MTLVRGNRSDPGGDFLILNLQMVTRVECRYFDRDEELHRATVFSSDGGSTILAGEDADRVVSALEDFAGYPRF